MKISSDFQILAKNAAGVYSGQKNLMFQQYSLWQHRVQEALGQCSQALMVRYLGYPVQGQALDLMILMDPLNFGISCDSMIISFRRSHQSYPFMGPSVSPGMILDGSVQAFGGKQPDTEGSRCRLKPAPLAPVGLDGAVAGKEWFW